MERALQDRQLLYGSAFVRAVATSMIGVLLGFHLAALRLDPAAIGIVVGAGLTGAAVATLVITIAGDRLDGRRALLVLTALGGVGGIALAFSSHPVTLTVAAFLGMANGMGRDRSAALVLEQAMLPGLVEDAQRTSVFARYHVAQDAGHAVGALIAAAPALVERLAPATAGGPALRGALAACACLSIVSAVLYTRLSRAIGAPVVPARSPFVSADTRRILWRIGPLFALDSLGGGFLTTALLSYFFHQRFGVGVGAVGPLFFGARVANAVSHVAAAWLARRIGLVNTMVFTHIPSSVLLLTVAWAPSFPVAAALFLVREGLVEMDVPTRQSYLMAVVAPHERTLASGVAHLVRVAGWAVASMMAGTLMAGATLMTPLVVAATIKIVYDLALYVSFRRLRPPEEGGASHAEGVT
jgi:MFS family permease